MVFISSDRPTDIAALLPPDKDAARETAWASAEIVELSPAIRLMSPALVLIPVEVSIYAWTSCAILLSVHRPAADNPVPVPPDAATAAEAAATVASMVAAEVALSLMPRSAVSF